MGSRRRFFAVQSTGSIGPTMKIHVSAPNQRQSETIRKGQKKWPVRSSRNPATAGATTPDELPTNSCKPHQRPTACEPASVWVMAHMFELVSPKLAPVSIRNAIDQPSGASTQASKKIPALTPPHTMNILRTKVGRLPARIQRSDSQPQLLADRAAARKKPPPILAMAVIERWRSRTR